MRAVARTILRREEVVGGCAVLEFGISKSGHSKVSHEEGSSVLLKSQGRNCFQSELNSASTELEASEQFQTNTVG